MLSQIVWHGRQAWLFSHRKKIPLDYLEITKHVYTINLKWKKEETKTKNVNGSGEHASRLAGMLSEMRVADNGATRIS